LNESLPSKELEQALTLIKDCQGIERSRELAATMPIWLLSILIYCPPNPGKP